MLDKKLYLSQSTGMESGGGTQLWCPKCDAIRACKVLWFDNASKGNFIDSEFPDLHYRERPRECNKCGEHFNTYEINQSAIEELKELRKLIQGIRQSIEEKQKAPTKIQKLL
jgi:transcriptional regulator NrdR family protein